MNGHIVSDGYKTIAIQTCVQEHSTVKQLKDRLKVPLLQVRGEIFASPK